jgi:hypothetical protein
MSVLRRIPVTWQTGAGGAGVSFFYSIQADDVTTALGTFFNAIKGPFPNVVSWNVPAAGDTIESTTGALVGSWSGGTSASITGGTSGTYAAGTGAYVRWLTNTVRNGRKFVGRTFLVPLVSGVYDNDGTITGTNLTTFQNAANTLVSTSTVVVWGRPSGPGAADGLFAEQTGAVVPDKVTSLRSRRS